MARVFGGRLAPEIVESWKMPGQKQVIAQAELAPLLIARDIWKEELRSRRISCFIDNEAIRWPMMKTLVRHPATQHLLDKFWKLEAALCCCSWFERVPTESNLADGPSRLQFEEVSRLGFRRDDFPQELLLCP